MKVFFWETVSSQEETTNGPAGYAILVKVKPGGSAIQRQDEVTKKILQKILFSQLFTANYKQVNTTSKFRIKQQELFLDFIHVLKGFRA